MKRKEMIRMAMLLLAAGAVFMLRGQKAQAADRKKVTAVLRGTTLTVSGRGTMPASLTNKKGKWDKVKRIVVKKGVTALPVNAFTKCKNVTSATVASSVKTIGEGAFNCKRLKSLTIPGRFRIKSSGGDEGGYSVSGKVDTVTFNTDLQLARVAAFDANNLVVRKNDPKYKSIDGVIYSKDKKAIVRVPFQRKTIALAEGCEVFCLQSVLYANRDSEGDPAESCRIKKIILPASVKQVESERYYAFCSGGLSTVSPGYYNGYENKGLQVGIKSRKLDGQSLSELLHVLQLGIDTLTKQLPDQISQKGDMYITNDHVLLLYRGTDSTVIIPDGVTKIGDYSFFDNQRITKLILPEGVKEIGKEAFCRCSPLFAQNASLEVRLPSTLKKLGDGAFSSNVMRRLTLPEKVETYGKGVFEGNELEEVVLPGTMRTVPERMLESNHLKKLVIPDSVQKIGKQAFQYNALETVHFGKNLTEIGAGAFFGNDKLRHVTIPSAVAEIGADAWGETDAVRNFNGSIVIQGSGKGISDQAFSKSFVLDFSRGPEEARVSLYNPSVSYFRKRVRLELEWSQVKRASGYELVVSTAPDFTKNKKKITVKAGTGKRTVTVKGKYKAGIKIYARMRPFTRVNGRKVYGRWSKAA